METPENPHSTPSRPFPIGRSLLILGAAIYLFIAFAPEIARRLTGQPPSLNREQRLQQQLRDAGIIRVKEHYLFTDAESPCQFTSLQSIAHLLEESRPRRIALTNVPRLTSSAHLPSGLQSLLIVHAPSLHTLSPLPPALKELLLIQVPGLITIEHLPGELQTLILKNCPNLTHIGPLPTTLQKINITDCPSLDAETRQRLKTWAQEGKPGERQLIE